MLTRWFPSSAVVAPQAAWLDVILYSRQQLVQEYADMPSKEGAGVEVRGGGGGRGGAWS